MDSDVKKKELTWCDRCGRPAVIAVDEQQFCAECSQLAGSCCMEFGADDLWSESLPEREVIPVDFREERAKAVGE